MIETFTAWAIDSRSSEGHGLLSRYWFFTHKGFIIPPQMEGCRISLFKTRALARANLAPVRSVFKNARVVKAKVTIEI